MKDGGFIQIKLLMDLKILILVKRIFLNLKTKLMDIGLIGIIG